jgi:hypothetical protein
VRGTNYARMNERIRRHKTVSLSQTRRLVRSLLGPEGRVWFEENSYTIGTQLPEGGRFILGSGPTLPEAFHWAITARLPKPEGETTSSESPAAPVP